ncbi:MULTISPECIES: ABC transporter permease [unclassified Crossiella]|uniref:ABC transporter permease n=1 Tax=unclassified Crossiella TaxID=2620835 RepID=UPI001FFEC856|nr:MULTISPECIES: ABC transporter permease [unclassified Crossiella]MCK2244518.1 ABC transporter permease [Crossiella sp. S99.2]MCK2258149.1 ABC transporter permease [Crossiella sp. S99.1]
MKWSWIPDHASELALTTLEHSAIAAISVLCGLMLALPLGVLAVRLPVLKGVALGISGVLFTIPSLALFILLLPLTGLSYLTAVIGLTTYTLVVLVRNTVEGLATVPHHVREAARAMGYGGLRTLLTVELPLALPVIMAGVRVATVMAISLVSVAGFIGHGALGQLFIDGFQRDFAVPVIAGVALTLLLALIADLALVGLQHMLTPWTRRGR